MLVVNALVFFVVFPLIASGTAVWMHVKRHPLSHWENLPFSISMVLIGALSVLMGVVFHNAISGLG